MRHVTINRTRDTSIFDELRETYKKLRGWKWYLSMMTCGEIELVKLIRVYDDDAHSDVDEVVVNCTSEGQVLPDLKTQTEYHYQMDSWLDKASHVLKVQAALSDFYRRRVRCMHPDGTPKVVYGVPHRVSGDKLGSLDGYGIRAIHYWSLCKAAMFALVTQGWAWAFIVWWLLHHPGDVQNAFTPAFYSLGVVTVFVTVPDLFSSRSFAPSRGKRE